MTERTCPCGRPIVILARGKLLVCAGTCDASPQFCTCQAIGLLASSEWLQHLLTDVRGQS